MNISPVSFSGLAVNEARSTKYTNSSYGGYSFKYTLPFMDELEKTPDDFSSFEKKHVIPFSKSEFCQMTNKKIGDSLSSETYEESCNKHIKKVYTIV
ncbi:MAG: hypothetical protein LUE64_06345 [Candidatus Gastranaerophilales bacterium]|nr:hypothetical protein [Candidatus Gastranaerophilales bacterium]